MKNDDGPIYAARKPMPGWRRPGPEACRAMWQRIEAGFPAASEADRNSLFCRWLDTGVEPEWPGRPKTPTEEL